MSNILITGASGQLGREFQDLAPHYPGHNFYYTDLPNLDITDAAAVERFVSENKVEAIVNCAAYTSVDKAEAEPDAAFAINARGAGNLARAAKKRDAVMVQISTDYVFDGSADVPYSESHPVSPQTVYGQSKMEGENEVALSGCCGIIVRTSWLYSAYGQNFVRTMLAASGCNLLKVVADQVGSPTYAAGLASAVMELLPQLPEGECRGEVFHYADQGAASWYDLAVEALRLAGAQTAVEPITSREYPSAAQRPAYSVLDTSKIRRTFGVKIPCWRDSLAVCIDRICLG